MKKYIICIVILSVGLVGALALAVYVEIDRTDTIHNLDREMLSLYDCNEYQADMSNYVIEHYDDIITFSNELTADFDYEHDYIILDYYYDKREALLELLDKYNLTHFYNEDYSYITVLNDNTVKFWYGTLQFDNDNGYGFDYGIFSFYAANDKVVIEPYLFDQNHKGV